MQEHEKKKLDSLREEIDKIDSKIVESINRRTEIVLQIGELKNKANSMIYSPAREKEVYNKVFEKNNGPIRNKSLAAIYREIMSASLALEKEITVGFMGPEGSFSHQATINKFGSSLKLIPFRTIQDAFKAVEDGECDYSVVPVENSTEGGVNDTLDMFIDSPLKICSELLLPIRHNLMNIDGDIKKIKKIYSNPQIFGQCRKWLYSHIPTAELIEVSSSSRSAQMASEDPQAGAIGSELCTQLYNLTIVNRSIQDLSRNTTRFAVLSTDYPKQSGDDKTSILVFIKDKVGALHDTLLYFKSHSLNLTRIESRPSKKNPWEYYFFIDFMGHCDDIKVKDLLENLKEHCVLIKVLGSYPIFKEPTENE